MYTAINGICGALIPCAKSAVVKAAYVSAYCAIIYMYVGIFAELSFKMHVQADDKCEGLSLYKVVEENKSTEDSFKSWR